MPDIPSENVQLEKVSRKFIEKPQRQRLRKERGYLGDRKSFGPKTCLFENASLTTIVKC